MSSSVERSTFDQLFDSSFQYRNWFNDEYQRRFYYGVLRSPEHGVRRHVARFFTGIVALVIIVFVFPTCAVYLTFKAGASRSEGFAEDPVPGWHVTLILLVSIVWVFLHLCFLPGRRYDGPVCGHGSRPTYKRNGFVFFLLSLFSSGFLTWAWGSSAFHILARLCLRCVALTVFAALSVYAKGKFLGAESSPQFPNASNLISDILYGRELYPKVGELHLKQAFIRLGAVLNLFVLWSCFFAQIDATYAAVAIIGLQFLHAGRRFWNEECYAHSMEVAHYRVGMCELFRHLVLKPFVLNLGTISNVIKPVSCSPIVLLTLCFATTVSIILTYLVDRQKFLVKYNKGKCTTWGRMASTIHAFYADEDGVRRGSVLLFSGFWGWARHVNYTFEFITYCLLSLPALFNFNWFSALPPVFVFLLLVARSREDFKKCRRKYGPYWIMYCAKVPHTFIPWLW